MDTGESAAECCAREVLEETGLVVSVGRLIGVYSTPHRITEYSDGNRKQAFDLVLEAVRIAGGQILHTRADEIYGCDGVIPRENQ